MIAGKEEIWADYLKKVYYEYIYEKKNEKDQEKIIEEEIKSFVNERTNGDADKLCKLIEEYFPKHDENNDGFL